MSTDKQSIDWYNQNARGYTEHVRDPNNSVYHSHYEKPAMYSLVPDIQDKRVLSLGCGSGEDISYLKTLGATEAIGVDISSELIKIASADHPECVFRVMDMEHLDFSDNTFDFAYSSLAIHYIEDWTNAFKEIYRVLKPGSFFLFSCGHPVRYAMRGADTDTEWVSKLEISKNKETKEVVIVGDYLSRSQLKNGLGKNTVNTWYKSFSEIAAEIKAAGFLIEQMVDPKPLKELNDLFPEKYKKLSKIPEFAIFRLLKR